MTKLFYIILGATPIGRNTEQHDVFFGIAPSLKDLVQPIKDFWPEAGQRIHIDCYREVTHVDGYSVKISERGSEQSVEKLFFVNLGGYTHGRFEELHEQHLMVGTSTTEIIKRVKQTDFYQNMGFKNAESHIDDKHGVDVDEIFNINDILPQKMKDKYTIVLEKSDYTVVENEMHLGYLKLDKIK